MSINVMDTKVDSVAPQLITVHQYDVLVQQAVEDQTTHRINLHPNVDDPVHEMVICHPNNITIPWHKHINKSVSLTLLRGSAYVYYREQGGVATRVTLSTDDVQILRLPPDTWYRQEVLSDAWLFLETIKGPWKPEDTVWDRGAMSVIRATTKCRLCKQPTQLRADLGAIPINNMYWDEPVVDAPLVPIRLRECPDCGYVGLEYTVSPDILYGDTNYEFTSKRMGSYLTKYADWIIRNFTLPTGARVLDIGCNDGYFLSVMQGHGYAVIGMDPSLNPVQAARERGITVYQTAFESKESSRLIRRFWSGDQRFHLIASNRMWANVDDLRAFTANIKQVLHPDGYLILETGYLVDILDKSLVETIYPEHVTYDLLGPLVPFFQSYGLQVACVFKSEIKGGSIRVVIQHAGSALHSMTVLDQETLEHEWRTRDPWAVFEERLGQARDSIHFALGASAHPCGYGAGVPGIALAFYLGLQDQLEWIVDEDPDLWGKYMPGTTIQIRPPSSLEESDLCIILAHRYAKDIIAANRGFRGKWITPFQNADMKSFSPAVAG